MKQILSLALALLPCLAWAQYPSNGNQKITLGEQTTADGLVYRGVLADTGIITPSSDTSAYIILDTVNHRFYNYNRGTNVWSVAGGGTAVTSITGGTGLTGGTITSTGTLAADTNFLVTRYDTSAMLTPYWRAGRFSGTLPVANGGTGSATKNFVDLTTTQTVAGIKQFTDVFAIKSATNDSFKIEFSPSNTNPNFELYGGSGSDNVGGSAYWRLRDFVNLRSWIGQISSAGNLDFYFNYGGSFYKRHTFTKEGNFGIGTSSPLALLNVMGTVRINSASAPDANYYLQLENSSSQKAKANAWDTYSDSRIKTNRQPIINAIDKINLLNPTYYNQHDSYVEDDLLNIDYNNSYKSLGFIAQEVYEVIPEAVNMGTTNELWAMDYTKLIPILTKAIQEQQALIKALEQKIINLENK